MLPKVEIKRKTKIDNNNISNLISSAMPKGIKKHLKIKSDSSSKINNIYKKAVGEQISAVSFVLKYEKDILTIKVTNAVWKNELKFREENIKNLINSQKIRNLQINKIIFK